jgi:uncharacterized alkaline shock family protein YloU
MHDGQATISPDILARYAGDAAREVQGVHAISGRHGVKVDQSDGVTRVVVHLEVTWGTSIPAVGAAVQSRIRDYLARMAKLADVDVHVVVDGVAP